MIEAWWRSLKHQWLYLHDLTSEAQVRDLVAFYVTQHNDVMPHHAFHGRTPSEVFEGIDPDLPERLREQHREAQRRRIVENQATRCTACDPAAEAGAAAAAAEPEKPPDRTSLDGALIIDAASHLCATA